MEPIGWISELQDDPHYRVGDESLEQTSKCRKSRSYQRGRIFEFDRYKKLGHDDATSTDMAGKYAGLCWVAAARDVRDDVDVD